MRFKKLWQLVLLVILVNWLYPLTLYVQWALPITFESPDGNGIPTLVLLFLGVSLLFCCEKPHAHWKNYAKLLLFCCAGALFSLLFAGFISEFFLWQNSKNLPLLYYRLCTNVFFIAQVLLYGIEFRVGLNLAGWKNLQKERTSLRRRQVEYAVCILLYGVCAWLYQVSVRATLDANPWMQYQSHFANVLYILLPLVEMMRAILTVLPPCVPLKNYKKEGGYHQKAALK